MQAEDHGKNIFKVTLINIEISFTNRVAFFINFYIK